MEKKRSAGIIIFGILMIIGSLVQLPAALADITILLKPLPYPVIIAWYFIVKLLLILGIISGIGILFLKDAFRRIAVFLSIFTISHYIIDLPFFILKNGPNFVDQQVMKFTAIDPTINRYVYSSMLWLFGISAWAIDIGFAICVIYFFTRPKIRKQFK